MDTNPHAAAKQEDHVDNLKEVKELKKKYHVCGDEESQKRIVKQEDEHDEGTKAKDEKARTSSAKANFDERDILLVVAAVIATVTYQAALAPPPSIWKEGVNLDYKCLHETWHRSHSLRQPSFLRDCPALKYFLFMFFNTLTLSTSIVSIFLLLTAETLITTGKVMIALSIIWLLWNYTYLIMSLSPDLLSALVLCIPIYLALPFFVYLLMKYWIQDFKKWKNRIRSVLRSKLWGGKC